MGTMRSSITYHDRPWRRKEVFGGGHPATANSLNILGSLCSTRTTTPPRDAIRTGARDPKSDSLGDKLKNRRFLLLNIGAAAKSMGDSGEHAGLP